MKFLNSKAGMVAVGVGVVAIVAYVVLRKSGKAAGEALGAIGDAVNPVNPENIFYRGVNAVGDAVNNGQSDGDFSLGSAIYDGVDAVWGWFGRSDADKQAAAEKRARESFAGLDDDEQQLFSDQLQGIGG